MRQVSCLCVVLAAGEGTRMNSAVPKVMHAVAGEPMLAHILRAASGAGDNGAIAVVVGPQMDTVAAFVENASPDASIHIQEKRLGTAHAVLTARGSFSENCDTVVLYGDTPLITCDTIARLRDRVREGADIAVLGFDAADPTGYGRMLMDGDRLVAIREERDATAEEQAVSFCNSGVMCFRAGLLPHILEEIGTKNAKGEYYLTDAIEIAHKKGLVIQTVTCPEEEVMGVNSRGQLAVAEAAMQARLRARALEGGATLIAPETVFMCSDTRIGKDVVIEPNVVLGPRVTVRDGATIRSFTYAEDSIICENAIVGPFARLRPGAEIGEGARIGNFVEIKASQIEQGAKVNHLSYIGDARVGSRANIGAGTIVCNYDGHKKYRTDIGSGAFIGSNSALVAPISIGDRAYVASGSTLTGDVEADALAIGRARQVDKPGGATRIRGTREAAGQKNPKSKG